MGLAFQNLGRQFCSPKYTIVNILYTLLTVTALNILESYTTQDDNAFKATTTQIMFNSIKYKHTILDNENPLKGTSTLVTLVSSLRNSIQKRTFAT